MRRLGSGFERRRIGRRFGAALGRIRSAVRRSRQRGRRIRLRRKHFAALLLHFFNFIFDGRNDVIVVLEIFEEIAHIKKCVAIEADIHKSRLHAGQHACNAAFVNASD
jgi:hypothetical protein